MSPLERFLLTSIIFLAVIRVFILPDEGDRTAVEMPPPPAPDASVGSNGTATVYDWNPAQFTRRGIPSKLTLTADGRVPDGLRLTDTQKTFVYAAMLDTHKSLLSRAHKDCPADMRRDIVRWQARHTAVIADAARVLERLAPGRNNARQSHNTISQDAFAQRICPTIEHYLATGAYEPHPEAIDRLAQAARTVQPQ